jgi:SagB-type dehydrogenase family enzyme
MTSPASTAIAYHSATKYAPATIGNHPGLDWSRQPLGFKDYSSLTPVELAAWLPFDPNPFNGRARSAEAAEPDGCRLSGLARWIFAVYGVTGVIPNQPHPTLLRTAPSAGGLYPAEIYLVVRDFAPLAPGLYGYDPRRHRLIPLWADAEVATHLAAACYGDAAVAAAPVALVVTGVFERSRWRYGERAYRRILLDSGHLLGNACLAAPALGMRAHLTAAFCDDALGDLLRLDAADEGALAVIALNAPGDSERPSWSALPSAVVPPPEDAAAPLLDALHRAGRLPLERPRAIAREDLAEELEARYGWHGGETLVAEADGRKPQPLARACVASIHRRRSTRQFSRSPFTRTQLSRILAAAYAPESQGLGRQPALAASHLMTFVAVSAVDGLESGVWYLAPHGLELRLVRAGVAREALQFLCLGQELGGDAAAVVFHTADLSQAVRHLGDRAYRYLHLDAGMLGERLDLAALAEGLGASGIGGFFDDHVTELLGIPDEQAVVYITCLGVPVSPDAPDDDEAGE